MIQNISAHVARSDGASSPRQRGLDENTVVCLASCALMGLWGKPQAQVEAGASVSGVYSLVLSWEVSWTEVMDLGGVAHRGLTKHTLTLSPCASTCLSP